MPSEQQSDQGPQVFPHSAGLNAGQIHVHAAKHMANRTTHLNVHIHEPPQWGPDLGLIDNLDIASTEGSSRPPQPGELRSLETVPTPKGLKKLLAALANFTKGARPSQGVSPYDSDTPGLTPASSSRSSPSSSQEDVTLESMVAFQSQHPVPQDPEDDTPTLAYHQNMLKANRGLPIFRQECSYGDQETAPGDVGTYSVDSGSFNKIFNIWGEEFTARCFSMASGLPPRNVKVTPNAIPRNSEIHRGVSPDVKLCRSNRREVESFDFYCQSKRGAVLVATSPAEREHLDGHVELGSWLASHPELLYEHANTKRQLSDKEPLYIVTGCIKSESCALAAFTKQGVAPYDLLRLESTMCDGDDQPSFAWTKQCAFSDATFGVSGQVGLKNQTLFVEGYTLDFSAEFRSRMKRTAVCLPKTSPVSDTYRHRMIGLSGVGPRTGREFQQEGQGGGQQSSSGAPNSYQLRRGQTFAGGSHGQASHPGQHSAGQSNLTHRSESHEVTVNFFPGSIPSSEYRHPSSRITKQLLEMTGKDFALYHDDQWRCALDKIDTAEFAQTIIAESKVVTQNGIAFLEPAVGLEVQNAPKNDFFMHDSDDSGRRAELSTIWPTAHLVPQPSVANEAWAHEIRSVGSSGSTVWLPPSKQATSLEWETTRFDTRDQSAGSSDPHATLSTTPHVSCATSTSVSQYGATEPRIRPKKCDEERSDRDTCRTCERPRLECVGFGAKRPARLRENRNVVALREQSKVFLASQGLVKGHSGAGPRPNDGGSQILRLSAAWDPLGVGHHGYHTSDSDGPPTRSLSLSDDDDRHRLMTSSIRDQPTDIEPVRFPPIMNTYSASTTLHYARSPSPGYSSSSAHEDQHSLAAHYNPPSLTLDHDSASSSLISPAIQSRFGKLYTDPILLDNGFDNIDFRLEPVSPLDARDLPFATLYSSPTTYLPQTLVDDSIRTYVRRIAEIQYLLGDRSNLPNMIWESCQNHGLSQKALSLLISICYRRQQHPNQAVLTNSEMHAQLRSLLDDLTKSNLDDPDNAIAALHGVSMFLFDGGQGAWFNFLQLASKYVMRVLHSNAYGNPKDALLYANWKDAFIVKTSIWFDVLASITTGQAPHFLVEVRAMFNPNFPSVYDPSFDSNPQCSMMSPLGCENRVVWAFAETSMLASWKDKEKANHRLNIMELVQKASEIEGHLYQKPFPTDVKMDEEGELEHVRYMASEVFRCSTKLFLATVVNDDYPQVRKIQDCVNEVVLCYRNLFQPKNGLDPFVASRSVLRSTVFAIYLAGSMTNSPEHRQELVGYLDRESAGRNSEGVGNCASIRKLLDDVWRDMQAKPAQPVPWRQFLKEREILLV